MSSFAWIIILTLILTGLGTLVLLLITVKYYWGERGTPPLTGDARLRQKEEEMRLRAKQFEHSKTHRWETRSQDFLDNTKSAPKK